MLDQLRHPAGRRRDPDGLLPHRQAVVDRALRRHARHHRVRQGAHQRPQSAVRHVGARRADQPDDLPAGLDPLHLQLQPAGHRGRPRSDEDAGRDRLRDDGDDEGRALPRRPAGPAEAPAARSATSTASAWRCAPRSARPTASRRTRRCSTAWSTIGLAGDLEHRRQEVSASCSTSAATTRTSSPSRRRCTSAREEIDLALTLLDQLLRRAGSVSA